MIKINLINPPSPLDAGRGASIYFAFNQIFPILFGRPLLDNGVIQARCSDQLWLPIQIIIFFFLVFVGWTERIVAMRGRAEGEERRETRKGMRTWKWPQSHSQHSTEPQPMQPIRLYGRREPNKIEKNRGTVCDGYWLQAAAAAVERICFETRNADKWSPLIKSHLMIRSNIIGFSIYFHCHRLCCAHDSTLYILFYLFKRGRIGVSCAYPLTAIYHNN